MFNSPLNDKRYHLEDYSMIGLWVASKGAFGEDSECFYFFIVLKGFPLSVFLKLTFAIFNFIQNIL
ncbi:hypothetical protein CFF26_01280 [Listeria monocytogenes]|nr:hypothetical protein [Listeria monocytogenes]EDO0910496.1 hypothetical protein [Listeria monocytogenes]EDP7491400.1 hypothetical protein [Listeria monocytogenes]